MSAPPLTDACSILQHLETMAAVCNGAVVTSRGRQIFGELGYPNAETGVTTFLVHPALRGLVSTPQDGQVVHVEYQTGEARYGFVTQVRGAHTEALWRLARPMTIERRENRQAQRVQVAALFRTQAGGRGFQKVIDLGEGGFCLLVDQPRGVGASLRGWLDVDGLPPIAVSAQVRHERQTPQGWVTGCSFESMGEEDRGILVGLLKR